jgi:hypothetical protein
MAYLAEKENYFSKIIKKLEKFALDINLKLWTHT